ncbi:MAG: 4-(cytidine 5'-diphospho)-2-C-methyl-D-erythritol kinase [Acidobacteriota bacterium]|nr:4-(cytidine 5'-diphospho)-2-C-methyl-D-erythritol kinase [Acidobacteriota bacterium]
MSTSRVRLRSLAKINLDLRVLNKRADGFHELRTVFQTVSLADKIEVEYTPGRTTRLELDSTVQIADNLILRAADLALGAMGTRARVRFRLIKKIPMGGGLGGGSSNAAAVLLALPVLARKPLPMETLMDLGSQLGSDVPFFFLGGAAAGLGRGTELYPLPDLPSRPALLIAPGVHISTATAYADLRRKLTKELPSRIINSFQAFVGRLAASAYGDGENDFESVVFGKYPQLESIRDKLLAAGAETARMSGSGSTLFGIFRDRKMRDRAALRIEREPGAGAIFPVTLVSRRRYQALWRRQLGIADMGGTIWPPRSR